jgi:hypothetical protein
MSPLLGPAGNKEFFVLWSVPEATPQGDSE